MADGLFSRVDAGAGADADMTDLDWIECPVCGAGSPAGISTCPRCRYRFRLLGARPALEFKGSPVPRGVPHRRRAGGQFTLAAVCLAVAAFAVAFAWPILAIPACGTPLVLLLHRWGLSFIDVLSVLAVIGIVIGLALPSIVSP